jgi:hypothetical protein
MVLRHEFGVSVMMHGMKARKDRRIEQLAGLMADGYAIKDAAPIIGVTVDRTRRLWRGIKRDLGWQAA